MTELGNVLGLMAENQRLQKALSENLVTNRS